MAELTVVLVEAYRRLPPVDNLIRDTRVVGVECKADVDQTLYKFAVV
jgi:hypothetical protein